MVHKELAAQMRWVLEEAWCNGNIDALGEIYAASCVAHKLPYPDLNGLEANKQYIAVHRLAYSDIRIALPEWITEGDTVAFRYTFRMKHTNVSPVLPGPPTGRDVTLQGCGVIHLKDDKIIEEWAYSDFLGFLQQLGVLPLLG